MLFFFITYVTRCIILILYTYASLSLSAVYYYDNCYTFLLHYSFFTTNVLYITIHSSSILRCSRRIVATTYINITCSCRLSIYLYSRDTPQRKKINKSEEWRYVIRESEKIIVPRIVLFTNSTRLRYIESKFSLIFACVRVTNRTCEFRPTRIV